MVHRFALALALTLSLGGCKKEAPAPPAAPTDTHVVAALPSEDLDSMQQFLIETGQKDLRSAKESLGRGENPLHLCAAVTSALPKLEKLEAAPAKAFIAEATLSCGFEIPLAWGEQLVKKMRAVRQEKPAEVFFVECVEVEMAVDGMTEERRKDPKVIDLLKQHAELCPNP